MFEAFYKLSTNPFRLTPDPKFCFRHPSYNQAYAYLQYALRLGEGLIMVTGRPGIGKTTLVEVFLTEIEHNEVVAARVASANVEAADLLRAVAYSYGIDVVGLDKATILLRLEQFFIRETRSGKRVLLIIDEAQGLPHIALEELRLLADLQMDSRPLLQLFLVGQEKLRGLMREPDMEQFQQRVIGACHLEPLDLTETKLYMQHRLRTAGWNGDPELSGAAVLAIYQYSKGVPRHVNKICTRLLLHGMLEETHELHKKDVLTVAEELRAEQLAPMEHDDDNEAVSTDAAQAVPELESGSLSIAGLALRVDRQDAEQQQVGDQPAAEAVDRVEVTPGVREEPELMAVGNERVTSRIPTQEPGWRAASAGSAGLRQQNSRQRLSGVGEFPNQLPGRRRQARATLSPGEAAPVIKSRTARPDYAVKGGRASRAESGTWRSLMSALISALSRYAGETTRMFGRLRWQGKLAVLVGVLVMVNLVTAVLMMNFVAERGDRKSLLVGYPQPVQDGVNVELAQASTAGENNRGTVSRETDPTVDSARPQADGGQDDWFADIVDSWDSERVLVNTRGRMLERPVPEAGLADTAVQETIPAAEPDMATVETAVASATTQPDTQLKVDEQLGKGASSRVSASSEVPILQGGAVLSQDMTGQNEELHLSNAVNPADSDTLSTAPELLAKAAPSVAGEDAPPARVEEKAVPRAVSRQEKIAELLSLGHQSLKRDRLLIPTTDSAYKYYQQTLILEPGNDEALFGIERIVARYIALARKALERQDEMRGRRYIDRGLSINPTDKRLLALRNSLDKPVVVAEPEVQPVPVQSEQQTPAAEPEPEPEAENFISRIKAFFTKVQSPAEPNAVVVEERR